MPLQQMQYVQQNVMDDQFSTETNNFGRIKGYPAPDIIHASSPCNELLALRRLGIHEAQGPPTAQMLVQTLHHIEGISAPASAARWGSRALDCAE
eukprot:1372586-Pleurochrysis_carterae.AAC.1